MEKIYKEDYKSMGDYAEAIIGRLNSIEDPIKKQLFSSNYKCNIGDFEVTNIWPWNRGNVNLVNLRTRLDDGSVDLSDICDKLFSYVEENRAKGKIDIYLGSDNPCISLRKDKYRLLEIASSKSTGLENSLKLAKELGLKTSPFKIKEEKYKHKFIKKILLK